MSDRSEVEKAIHSLGEVRLIGYHMVGNEIYAEIETARRPVPCPSCGSQAEPKDRRTSTIRDLPLGHNPLVLLWKKRVWSCTNPQCQQVTWTETSSFVSSRHSLSNRAKKDLLHEYMEKGTSVAQLAQKWRVSWSTAMSAIKEAQELTKKSA